MNALPQLADDAGTYLSRQELHELTGFTQHAKQTAWLKDNKWPFEISGQKRILVLRAYYLDRMHGRHESKPAPTLFATRRHNFDALSH